jgi:cysteine desulfurase family protein (TIGR01976 family)
MTSFNVEKIRKAFPSLESGTAFFDGPGGTQTPRVVADAIAATLVAPISNRGSVNQSEINADYSVITARHAMADLLDADPQGIVFGRSWTQLAYDFSRMLAKTWNPGDEIVVSRLDHDSNIRPWIQAAESVGAVVRWAEFDITTGELPLASFEAIINAKTKLVAVTGASNIIGTRPDLKAIGEIAHKVGAVFVIDGVHLTPHAVISIKNIGADLFGCSPYKFMGPHCGVMAGDPKFLETLVNDKLLPSTDVVPERFELGTLPYEFLSGIEATVDFIANMASDLNADRRTRIVQSMTALEEYENSLLTHLEVGLRAIPNLKMYCNASHRTPTLYFNIEGKNSADLYQHLGTHKINAPSSHFYAIEASNAMGLGETGAVRAGLAPYSTREDADRLIAAVTEFAND